METLARKNEEEEADEDNDAESDKEDTISKYRALLASASEEGSRGGKAAARHCQPTGWLPLASLA